MRVRLEKWSLISLREDEYKAPETGLMVLKGEVYNHPEHRDGRRIITSEVQRSEGRIVWTDNTEYELGVVDPGYEQWVEEVFHKSLDEQHPIKLWREN